MVKELMITTDPQEELLTQVDEHNKIIGSISRAVAHERPGVFYRTVYVLVKNQNREVLIQKRSPTKDLYPNYWDLSVGGHVNFGQSYEFAACKELMEELGLDVSKIDLYAKGEVLVRLPKSGEWFTVFEYNLKPGEMIFASAEEITDTSWITIEDIKKSMVDKSLQWYARPEQVIAALY
jgi:isopentenyldiphosphate isomerase